MRLGWVLALLYAGCTSRALSFGDVDVAAPETDSGSLGDPATRSRETRDLAGTWEGVPCGSDEVCTTGQVCCRRTGVPGFSCVDARAGWVQCEAAYECDGPEDCDGKGCGADVSQSESMCDVQGSVFTVCHTNADCPAGDPCVRRGPVPAGAPGLKGCF